MKHLLILLLLFGSITSHSQEQWLSKGSSLVAKEMKSKTDVMMVEESYSSDGGFTHGYFFTNAKFYLTFKFDKNDKCNQIELLAKDDFDNLFQKMVSDHCKEAGYRLVRAEQVWTGKIYDYTHFQISILPQEKFDTKIIYTLL